MEDNLQMLKKKGYSFYWNDADQHWWLTIIGKNGKLIRTEPFKATSRENAENEAVNRYIRGEQTSR